MTHSPLPVWRSMLYVPANQERFVAGAPTRGADAIIVDLEDSVAPSDKVEARQGLSGVLDRLADAPSDLLVRVNRGLRLLFADLEASVHPALSAIALPKVDDPGLVRIVDEYLMELELERGIPVGHTKIFARIETPRGIRRVDAILAASTRVVATAIGSGDLSIHAGLDHTGGGLEHAHNEVVTAARAAGVLPLGLAGMIVEFNDLDAFEALALRSKGLGSVGAPCIHPRQVPILNKVFGLDPTEVDAAEELIDAFEAAAADSRGAFMHRGQFIDYAHYSQALEIRSAAQTLNARREATSL